MTTLAIRAPHTPSLRVALRPVPARLRMPELAPHAALMRPAAATALCTALAAVPFGALAWLFIAF